MWIAFGLCLIFAVFIGARDFSSTMSLFLSPLLTLGSLSPPPQGICLVTLFNCYPIIFIGIFSILLVVVVRYGGVRAFHNLRFKILSFRGSASQGSDPYKYFSSGIALCTHLLGETRQLLGAGVEEMFFL